jgi:hypothetical protein
MNKEEFINKIQESLEKEKKLVHVQSAQELRNKIEKESSLSEKDYSEAESYIVHDKTMNTIKKIYEEIKSASKDKKEISIEFDYSVIESQNYEEDFIIEMGLIVHYFRNKGYNVSIKQTTDRILHLLISW